MATVTKTYTGNLGASYAVTLANSTTNLNVTGSTFNLTSLLPTITCKLTWSGLTKGNMEVNVSDNIGSGAGGYSDYNVTNSEYVSWSSGATKTLTRRSNTSTSLSTSQYFNSSTKTSRSLIATYDVEIMNAGAVKSGGLDNLSSKEFVLNLSQTVTLNVPPTFSEIFSYTDDFSGVPYANLTTANITLSSLTAYYGGDFTGVGKAEFTIGSQTVSKANPVNSDVLSIPLNAVGTFTPTVKVTDSRGQVTTHTLNAITVQGYVAPSVSFSVERTLPKTGEPTPIGKPDDEGESATITATFNFTDAIATLSAPTVAVADDSGVSQTVSTTWYSARASDGTLSGSVNWASLSSGDTVYGLVSITGNFNTQKSYQISITPQDSEGTGTTITQTLGSAFYTVDFYAGGHGIAFGQPATQDGFFCNMDAHFVDKNSVMRALFDFVYPVGSYYETSDTSFDPNVSWGGTWVEDTAGRVLISAGTNDGQTYITGGTGGERTHTLTPSETAMKGHSHDITTSGVASYFLTVPQNSNAVSRRTIKQGTGSDLTNNYYGANAISRRADTDATTDANATSALSLMQPYAVVKRWHRTA